MVVTLLLPNKETSKIKDVDKGPLVKSLPLDDTEDETLNLKYNQFIPYIIKKKHLLSFDSSVQVDIDKDQIFIELQNAKFKQVNFLDVKTKQVVKFSSELVQNLKLLVSYKQYFQTRERLFDETLTYIQDEGSLFRDLVLKKKGYLSDTSDYYEVDSSLLSTNTKTTTLRNTRVILFWRSLELKKYTIKRILTLGLLFLIGKISMAELIFYVKLELPEGSYEVKILQKDKTYVVIGIEKPIFSF